MKSPIVIASIVLAALGVALALGNCSDPSPEFASVLNRGIGAAPESLDPQRSNTTQAHTVQRDLFEGLTGYTADGELKPAAAASYSVADDGRTYTFRLRPEARWSNGDPVTAADFVYSFRRLVDPRTAAYYAEHLVDIGNAAEIVAGDLPPAALDVAATGEYELTVRLERPVPYFPRLLALPGAYPVHAPSIEAHGDAFTRAGNLVSNGAYRLVAREVGAYIELEKNPYYRDAAATSIERVRHHVTVEPGAELLRYRAGELHITQTVPPEAFSRLRAERPDELRVAPMLGVYFYGFNLRKEKLGDNRALRQALSMAIDRDVLVSRVTARGEQPAFNWVPPGVADYSPQQPGFANMTREARHAAARRLYREAGYGPDNPLELEIRYNTADTHQQIAIAVQSMWREVLGFEAALANEELRVLVANITETYSVEVFRLSWNGDYNDASSFLDMFQSDHPSNLFGYSNPDFDSLMKSAARQTDPHPRRLFLEEAEQTMLDDHPLIPLYFHVSKHLVSPSVAGWRDNVLDFHYSRHLSLRPVESE